MIELVDVEKTYHLGGADVHALRGVSLTIEPGEFVAIMGPSGSGKSTLMHLLGLLDVPSAGSYRMLGTEVSQLGDVELASLRSRTIGFVFQQFNLLPRATALENVAVPLLYSGDGGDALRPRRLLERVGLGDRLDHRPRELSGGQQQRVAIARALANEPRLILADEPTGNLDSTSEREIMAILGELNAQGITIVLVTHEPEIAEYARRVIRMRDGRILSDERKAESGAADSSGAMAETTVHREARGGLRRMRAHLGEAARALLGNKVRASLSMLGILIGVAAVIAMIALGTGASDAIRGTLSSLGSNLLVLRPGSSRSGAVQLEAGAVTRLTLEDAAAVAEAVPAVVRSSPSVQGRVQVTYAGRNTNTQVQGTTPTYASMRASEPAVGRFFDEQEVRERALVAVIGMTPATELFEGRSPIGERIKINRINFQVIGVLPAKGATGWRDQDDLVVIPISTAMRRVLGRDYVDSVDIEVDRAEAMEAAEGAVRAVVNRRHRLPASDEESFDVRNMADIQEALSETSRTMSYLLAAIAAISLVVGGIGIMNIMLVSVVERTREIGLRKALGARDGDVLAQFLIEAAVVAGTGGAAGVALGGLITLAMSSLAGWAARVSGDSVVLAVVFSLGVGIAFGIWPARKAASLNPIDALRYE